MAIGTRLLRMSTAGSLGGRMRRHAWIGFALLAFSHPAFENLSLALVQAGSTGGTIGKEDKSISGGTGQDRPRAAGQPKQPAERAERSDQPCNKIVGRWSW